jgi:hypothetical protein
MTNRVPYESVSPPDCCVKSVSVRDRYRLAQPKRLPARGLSTRSPGRKWVGVTEPGRYMLRFGWSRLPQRILPWEQYLNAAFTLYTRRSATGTEERIGEEFRFRNF